MNNLSPIRWLACRIVCILIILPLIFFTAVESVKAQPETVLYRYWKVKSLPNPNEVIKFLNGDEPYNQTVREAKVSMVYQNGMSSFDVFYKEVGSGAPIPITITKWKYKTATTSQDALNFLNGVSPYTSYKDDIMIAGAWRGYLELIIFYQNSTPGQKNQWTYQGVNSENKVLDWINGISSTPKGRFELAVVTMPISKIFFHIFAKKPSPCQAKNLWKVKHVSNKNLLTAYLNEQMSPSPPIIDGKVFGKGRGLFTYQYTVFVPDGMVILTRPIFRDSFANFAFWKIGHGIELRLVTAEWCNSKCSGSAPRFRMRNCLRKYYNDLGVKYAMLVGDAYYRESESYPPDQNLTEQWDLPAGYYQNSTSDYPHYTSNFYSDILDEPEFYWSTADLAIKVGIVPVRTLVELHRVLFKFMNYLPEKQTWYRVSMDLDNTNSQTNFQQIKDAVDVINNTNNQNFNIKRTILPETTEIEDTYEALFNTVGVIVSNAHGGWFYQNNVAVENFFSMSTPDKSISHQVNASDAFRFKYINGAFFAQSCFAQEYMKAISIDEAYIIAEKGPVITGLLIPKAEVMKRLHEGETIGDAYYGNYPFLGPNPYHLFGDPSLVIYDHMH
jgi:hypothetical protein